MNPAYNHRHVRIYSGNRLTYVCGCVNEIHDPSGVLHSVKKCDAHKAGQKEAGELGQAYYQELGTVSHDEPIEATERRYVEQLTEALGPLPVWSNGACALEIGCGISPYFRAIQGAGYAYLGIEPSEWAAKWMRQRGAEVRNAMVEESFLDLPIHEFILAAHVIEHLIDAPLAIVRLGRMLKPRGQLWIVVPNDEDPLNPDHLWTFSEATLGRCIEAAGLFIETMALRKYVAHESFIYCRAKRPS